MKLGAYLLLFVVALSATARADFLVRHCFDLNGQLIPGGGNCNGNDVSGCVDNNGRYYDTPNMCAAVAGDGWVKGCWSKNPGTTQFRAFAICRENPAVCLGRHAFDIAGQWCT